MMANLSQLILFERACYEADNREASINDLFNTKNRSVRFFDGEEIALSGTIGKIPLPRKFGNQVQKDVLKYRRDKTLVYAAFPIVGTHSELKQLGQKLCAPLVYFSCEIAEAEGVPFLVPNLEDLRVNMPIITALAALDDTEDDAVIDAISRLPAPPWTREDVHNMAAQFSALLPSVDFSQLSTFPAVLDAVEVHERATKGTLECLPATAMALLPNSPNTRGVLFELSDIVDAKRRSEPLRILFGETQASQRAARPRPSLAPSVLSNAQERVVRSCRSQSVTLVIGPPGTGKSHTIASVALDHLANNQSVLIASRNDQAVNVVADKIDQMLGPSVAVVRAGRKHHLRQMKQTLENLLLGITDAQADKEELAASRYRKLRKLDKRILQEESSIARNQRREIAWGEATEGQADGVLSGISRSISKTIREWQLGDFDAWERVGSYLEMLGERSELSRQFLRQTLAERTSRLVSKRRDDLKRFSQAIRARSDGKQQKLFKEVDFSVLLHAFPVWLCGLSDLSSVLPLQKDLFDLAILDEATQCDVASCIPLLQRAKRVAIVGDPKQLRHISFLSGSRQNAFAEERELDELQKERFDYRALSILDVTNQSIANQDQVMFLNEHFRSLPKIIDFSNREFYGGNLSIMRQRPVLQDKAVEVRSVAGERAKSGRNSIEADAIVEEIVALVKQQEKMGDSTRQSIGVLSPFRQQVAYLARSLDKQLAFHEMKRHDIMVGTAHSFQGEERDVMFISLAVDDHSHWASFRFLENPNLLNVSITRARHKQVVFKSFALESIASESLLRRWLDSTTSASTAPLEEGQSVDRFRDEVIAELESRDFQCWRDSPIAGIELDLVVSQQDRQLGIDLVGFPGALSEAYSLERYRVLHRSGLKLYPLSYRSWQDQKPECIARIVSELESQTSRSRESDT